MGVIEELAAKDAARQALGRAKQAEMGRVMNQGEQGLAAIVADPYVSGISQEDLHKLALVKQAQDANTSKAVMDMVAKNRGYNSNKDALLNIDADNNPIQYNRLDNEIIRYENRIDPGLAAKWMSSYKGK